MMDEEQDWLLRVEGLLHHVQQAVRSRVYVDVERARAGGAPLQSLPVLSLIYLSLGSLRAAAEVAQA